MLAQAIGDQILDLNAPGADFDLAIKTIQNMGPAFVENRKLPMSQRQNLLAAFITLWEQQNWQEILRDELGYPILTAEQEAKTGRLLLSALQTQLADAKTLRPLGPVLVYGSWSSPLLRWTQTVMTALCLGNSVLVLASPTASPLYARLQQLTVTAGYAKDLISVLSSEDSDVLELLVSHPTFRAAHVHAHTHEASFIKSARTDDGKRFKISWGGRNPVIFLQDAPLDDLNDLALRALSPHFLGESRFSRWFVQEKNYAEFAQKLDAVLRALTPADLGYLKDPNYMKVFEAQKPKLLKERNWLQLSTCLASLDFNNCSPYQQQEVVGPVLTVTRFKNAPEAIKFANTTRFADQAAVFSASFEKAIDVAAQLQMPHVYVNRLPWDSIDPRNGTFESGVGQEIRDWDFFSWPLCIHETLSL